MVWKMYLSPTCWTKEPTDWTNCPIYITKCKTVLCFVQKTWKLEVYRAPSSVLSACNIGKHIGPQLQSSFLSEKTLPELEPGRLTGEDRISLVNMFSYLSIVNLRLWTFVIRAWDRRVSRSFTASSKLTWSLPSFLQEVIQEDLVERHNKSLK